MLVEDVCSHERSGDYFESSDSCSWRSADLCKNGRTVIVSVVIRRCKRSGESESRFDGEASLASEVL